ncbi:CvpA family protein [uncultured Mailhella sp.]|uniref:CvpA family protein n=1 Tax=uncultured Mailhella sp. TaxID=1981031 RepID=UPI0026029965|nr:CvpA family protein [uncultured Mailhella sp.]
MFEINLFDTALVVILLFCTFKGLLRGLVREAAGLLGVAAGILLARTFSDRLSPHLVEYGISSGFAPLFSAAVLFLAGIFGVGFLAQGVNRLLENAFAGGINRVLGLVAGLAKGVLFAGVIGYVAIRLVPDASIVQQSQVLPPLMQVVQALAGSIDLHIPTL